MNEFDKFDEYKFLVEDTARITDRRQSISNLYTTINSILLAAIAVLFSETALPDLVIIAGAVAIMLAGIAISLTWKRAIIRYREHLRLRFDILREIENHPSMADSEKVYHREDALYPRNEDGQSIDHKGLFSNIEKRLPEVFVTLYVILTTIIILAVIFGLI